MKASTDLFILIKSLSKTEKGYFKKYFFQTTGDGQSDYVKLFDIIDKQCRKPSAEYDEEKIKNQLKGKNLRNLKHYLYNQILRALQSYYAKSSPIDELNRLIGNARMLFRKGLYKQCRKQLHRARELAKKYEFYPYLEEIHGWEIKLLYTEFTYDNYVHIFTDARKTSTSLQNLRKLEEECAFLFSAHHQLYKFRNEQDKKEIEARIAPLLSDDRVDITGMGYREKETLYRIRATYAHLSNYENLRVETDMQLIKLMEDHPEQIESDPTRYIYVLLNMADGYLETLKFEDLQDILKKAKKASESYPVDDMLGDLFISYNYFHLQMNIRQGKFDNCKPFLKDIEENIESSLAIAPKSKHEILFLTIAHAYFGLENYSRALFWINRILNNKEGRPGAAIYSFAQVINLIIHHDLGNFASLEYFIKSTKRSMSKKHKLPKSEDLIFQFLKKLTKGSTEGQLKSSLKPLRNELTEIATDPTQKPPFEYFDYISWVDSKIEGKPYRAVIKDKWKAN